MLLGVCSWSFERVLRDRDVVEIAAAACAAGFECIEAAWTSRSALACPDSPPRATDVPIANLATLEPHPARLFHPRAARAAWATAPGRLHLRPEEVAALGNWADSFPGDQKSRDTCSP